MTKRRHDTRRADELQYHDMKDAFYSKKHNNQQKNYHYDASSRGKGSFKTHLDRVYRDRRSRSRGNSSFSSRGRSLMSSYSRGPPMSSRKQSKKFPS